MALITSVAVALPPSKCFVLMIIVESASLDRSIMAHENRATSFEPKERSSIFFLQSTSCANRFSCSYASRYST